MNVSKYVDGLRLLQLFAPKRIERIFILILYYQDLRKLKKESVYFV